MKTLHLKLLFVIALIYNTVTILASPAYPGLVKMAQPDGTTISVYLKGDEKVHWMESEDGYSLMYNSKKAVVYAISDEDGGMTPSSVAVRDISSRSVADKKFLKDIPKKLSFNKAQINTLKSIWEFTPKSSSIGSSQFRSASIKTVKAICTLINFQDKKLVRTKTEFNNLMNQAGYTANGDIGSVNDYYYKNSYGQLSFVITVAGPYTVSKNWAYYGANDKNGNDSIDRVVEFAKEAANLTFNDININPSDYDNDGDGYIDAFHIIYAGYGEEAGGPPNSIWAHEYGFSPALSFGTKRLDVYSCSPELRGNSGSDITHIGVVCHELCHVLGAPDFYDIDYSDNGGEFAGTGKWDLMANGSWNNNGACPANINMYQKIKFGWVNPTILNQPKNVLSMLNSADNAVAYRYDTSTPGEYYILENRQKNGFDQYVPGTGLLIYHVSITDADIKNNTVNNKHPQKVYPVCASATTNPTGTPTSYGSINSTGCPFPGSSNNTSFTDYTVPSATAWNGTNSLKPITNIQEQGGTISFRFMMENAEPITNLQSTVKNQTIQLTWTKPASVDVVGYNIYRDNQLLISLSGTDNTSYTQNNVKSGSYSYCVTARYSDKESSPVCSSIEISGSPIDGSYISVRNLTAQNINNNKDIELDWDSPFVNNWMSHTDTLPNSLYFLYYKNISQFTAASRFTTDDLQNFYGSKLTQVRFAAVNTQCKYTIQVWLTDPENSGNINVPNVIAATKTVNNPSHGINDVTLDSPVSLENNKELWIGIQYQMSPVINDYVAGYDGEPSATQRNWLYYNTTDGWQYYEEADSVNWFICGYLQFDNTFLKAPADTWLRSGTPNAYTIYRDNVKIGTSKQTTYVDPQPPSGSHIYCVSVAYDDGKESEPVCVQASNTITSIENVNNPDEEINIYPNPIKKGETLTIHCDAQENSTLSIYNISGQLIQQEQITESVIRKKMDFRPGIYLLQIKNSSKAFIRKIIIR